MDKKLFVSLNLIISLSNQIYSLPIINSKCHVNQDLVELIHQLDGYVTPLAKNEVPIGMEFQLVREVSKSDFNKDANVKIKNQGVNFVINGKPIQVNLQDNSPLSRKLELFLTDDRIENSSILILEFTIDRIPIEECDGINHLKPPPWNLKKIF